MKDDAALLLRVRTLRREAAERQQLRAARVVAESQALQARRGLERDAEYRHQAAEMRQAVVDLIARTAPPLAVGLLQGDHAHRRGTHAARMTDAARRCHNADREWAAAQAHTRQRERALEKAGHLADHMGQLARRQAGTVQEVADDDHTASWIHQHRRSHA